MNSTTGFRGLNRRCHPRSAALGSLMACVAVVSALGGCAANEETIKKSDGYYQEGIASLSTDLWKETKAFWRSVDRLAIPS